MKVQKNLKLVGTKKNMFIAIADFQVYVDMQKIERYPHKIQELNEVIKKKAAVEAKVCILTLLSFQ